MELLLIRHAHALDAEPGGSDAARALSPKGRRRFEQCVDGLAGLGLAFDLLLHSPLLRAVQTADLLAPLVAGEMRVTGALAAPPATALLDEVGTTDAPAVDAAGRLARAPHRCAVVGHEPWLSELAAWLVLEDPEYGARFALDKGGVAWLVGDPLPGRMVLQALLTPKVLRALA